MKNSIFNAGKPVAFALMAWLWCHEAGAQTIAGFYHQVFPTGNSLWTTELAGYPAATSCLTNLQFNGSNGPVNGVTIFTMDQTGFKADNYLNGWADPNLLLPLGTGWYFKNPNAAFSFTALGFLYTGTNHLNPGLAACGSMLPLAGGLSSKLSFPVANGDSIFVLDATNNSFAIYTYSNQWLPEEPQMSLGQGFWARKAIASDWAEPAFISGFGNTSEIQPQWQLQTGQLNFFTFNATNLTFGQVFDTNAVALSTNGLGQLYAGTNADDSTFIPVGAPAVFSTAANGYINYGVVSVPFASGGQAVYAQLRAWKAANGASYEAASAQGSAVGKSSLMLLTAHTTIENNLPGLPPPDANVFPSFSLTLPAVLIPPVIQSIMRTNGAINLTWSAQAGGNYQLQYKTALKQTNWINLGGMLAATSNTLTGNDPSPTDPQRFYRVMVLPAGH